MGWYREWLECYISSYYKHWVDYQPIYISPSSHSPPMTSEHFINETLQGEKLFACFSFTSYNLAQLSDRLKLPPDDTTKRWKKGIVKERHERGKEAREIDRSYITNYMTIKINENSLQSNTGKCLDLFTLLWTLLFKMLYCFAI